MYNNMASQVLITGCSKGFGKEIALYLARDSLRRFKVHATMRNKKTRQDELKTEAGDRLDDTLFIRELDITKQETIDKTIKEIIDNEGKIDVLGKRSILDPYVCFLFVFVCLFVCCCCCCCWWFFLSFLITGPFNFLC